MVFPHLGKKRLVLSSAGRWVEVTVFSYMAKFIRKNTPVKMHKTEKVSAGGGHGTPCRMYVLISENVVQWIFQNSVVQLYKTTIR